MKMKATKNITSKTYDPYNMKANSYSHSNMIQDSQTEFASAEKHN